MSKRKYDEVSVLNILRRNKGISFEGKIVVVNDTNGNVGNGTWGKIDYLCKVHGYRSRVDKSTDGKQHRKNYAPKVVNPNKKDNIAIAAKHPAKISLVNLTKNAMKNSINNN